MATPAGVDRTPVSGSAAGGRDAATVSRKLALVFALLCGVGVAFSIELTRVHVFVHTDPDYHSLCAISKGINCETVALSPYAVFAGLPVAVWGILGYLVMGLLALSGLRRRRPRPTWPWGLLLLLTCFSALTSVVLAYISVTQIVSVCVFCIGSYAVNAVLLLVAVIAWRQARVRTLALVLSDAKALIEHRLLAVNLSVAGVALLVGLEMLVPHYWKAPGWNDLPRLPSGIDDNGHHWIGALKPTLTIVEFSDYECPHCRRAHKDARLLAAKHPNRIRLIHRHLPLDMACHPGLVRPFHEHACRFAEAAECAGLQGRFWEMNDALFSTQDKVKAKNLDPMDLAVRLGLNCSEFEQCMKAHTTAARLASDVQETMARRFNGTPTFLVGEAVFLGRIPDAELARLLGE
ncbi:MAG: thioredoxin domain-containing protein [Deltaproteobacteria bacterium]|nr:thioredoxin domain-containing protein [Deltaproteobacteria bacterium]